MTVMPSSPTGAYDLPYDTPYQPAPPPPDVWTAEVGGNALECYIAKETLNIRMGKDEPNVIGQPEPGSATFDVIGTPYLNQPHAFPWNDNGGATLGQWTDSGLTRAQRTATFMVWSGGAADVGRKTFSPHAWIDISAYAGKQATFTINATAASAAQWSLMDAQTSGNVTPLPFEWRLGYSVTSGKPWEQGTTTVVNDVWGQWQPSTAAPASRIFTGPEFTVPANGWVVAMIAMRVSSSIHTTTIISQRWETVTTSLNVLVPDWYDTGEKVVIKRNGLTVWTGKVTDEDREWSPSLGNVSRVNAAGPKAEANRVTWVPSGAAPGPIDGGTGWLIPNGNTMVDWWRGLGIVLSQLYGITMRDFAIDQPSSLKTAKIAVGVDAAPLKIMELLENAADTVYAQIWEERDGALACVGHPYYRDEMGGATSNDRITIDACYVETPVRLRNVNTRWNKWRAEVGREYMGGGFTPVGQTTVDKFEPSSVPTYGINEFQTNPMRLFDAAAADASWNHIYNVLGRALEQVDAWVVDRNLGVPDDLWTKILTHPMGHAVRIVNIPPGLFRDGRTTFDGFMWGWQLQGTDKVTLTLVDQRMFK